MLPEPDRANKDTIGANEKKSRSYSSVFSIPDVSGMSNKQSSDFQGKEPAIEHLTPWKFCAEPGRSIAIRTS